MSPEDIALVERLLQLKMTHTTWKAVHEMDEVTISHRKRQKLFRAYKEHPQPDPPEESKANPNRSAETEEPNKTEKPAATEERKPEER